MAADRNTFFIRKTTRVYLCVGKMIILITIIICMLTGCSDEGGSDSGAGNNSQEDALPIKWTPAVSGLPGPQVSDLALDPTDPNRLFAATLHGLYRTVDAGMSWSPILYQNVILPAEAVTIDPLNPATVYAGKSGAGIYKSADDGSTWTPVNSGLTDNTVHILSIDPISSGTVYAVTTTGIYKTTNAGAFWTALNSTMDSPISTYNQSLWTH